MELITCRECKRHLPKADFLPDKRRKDGIDHRCYECFYTARREARKNTHNPPVMEGLKQCSNCKEEKSVMLFSRNPKMKDGRANWCKSCHKKDAERRYKSDPEYYKEVSARKRLKLRLEVLTHYSSGTPACACCGETEIKFLAIDHINGGGNAHRKSIPRGHYIYQWLRNEKYPDGFQVLCHNCNMAKGFYGICPHQEKKIL